MSSPYNPGTLSYDLHEEGNKIASARAETDEVARAIHVQTVAIYQVGAALTKILNAINHSVQRSSN